jgi:outer membrane protein, multidrug efflux system
VKSLAHPTRRLFGALAFAVSLALAGCAAQPVPSLKTPLPAAWRHAQLTAAPAPDLKGWWQAFGDPTLDALVDEALRENLSLRDAAERLVAARTLRAHSRDAYLPYLRSHVDDEIGPDARASYLVSSFDMLWEFGVFGRREGTHRELQAEQDEASAQYAGAQVSLVAEVVADHLMLGAAHERLDCLARIRALAEQQLGLLKVRADLGLASTPQTAEAEAAVARARAAEAVGRHQVEAMAEQLAVLLGRAAPDPSWLERGQLAQLQSPAIRSTPADLLRTRPEIRRAEAAVLAAAGARDVAHAERLPNVGISGSIRWSTIEARNVGRATTYSVAGIGPLFDMPLFDWGLRKARADAQGHLLNAAVYAYRDAVLRGVAEVENALGSLQQQQQRDLEAAAAVDALRRGAAAGERRAALQLSNPLEALAARLTATDAELSLIDARTEHGMAYVALYKALGGAAAPAEEPSR